MLAMLFTVMCTLPLRAGENVSAALWPRTFSVSPQPTSGLRFTGVGDEEGGTPFKPGRVRGRFDLSVRPQATSGTARDQRHRNTFCVSVPDVGTSS